MTRSVVAGIILALCAPLALPVTAEAQLGSLIKKKVKEAITKPAEPAKPPEQTPSGSESSPQSAFNSDVLEITQPAFDAVIRGLNAELKLQEEFRQVLAKYPTPEQYEACKAGVVQSPEGAKIMSGYMKMMEKGSPAEIQRGRETISAELEALTKKQCPNDPNVWNRYNRVQKLDSIHEQAAEAAGLAASTSSLSDNEGTSIRAKFEGAPFIFHGGRLAFLTGRQYSLLVERIERGCEVSKTTPNTGEGIKVPGFGSGIYWVFTGGEMGVLTPANCNSFSSLTSRLMK